MNVADDSKFWKDYVSKRITLRKSYVEARQSLIVKSHLETMHAYDLSTEQDLNVGLELDVNHHYEILLMLKQIFLKDINSFDPIPFAKAFMRAWPVSIKMYSQIFIYCLHCFVKISTDKREALLMSETILDCIDSFFMKTEGQSMIDAFNMSTKSFQQLSKGLISFKEKLLKDSKGFKMSKSRAQNDLLNVWSNMLLSVKAPPYFIVTMRSFNEDCKKKYGASKNMLDKEKITKSELVTKQKKKSKLATKGVKSHLVTKEGVKSDLDRKKDNESDMSTKQDAESDLNANSDLNKNDNATSDHTATDSSKSDTIGMETISDFLDLGAKEDAGFDLVNKEREGSDLAKNVSSNLDHTEIESSKSDIKMESKSDFLDLDSKDDAGFDLVKNEGPYFATKVASTSDQPMKSEDSTKHPLKKLKKFVSPFNDRIN